MTRLAKLGAKVVGALVVLWGVGQLLARRHTTGDATSDEFELATYLGGTQRRCTATSLRRGVVRVCCGGVDLDLRDATLDPGGAALELSPTWGGVNLVVPPSWKVLVDDRSTMGGVDVGVTPPEELPGDAPVLRVVVTARMGGVAIEAAGRADESAAPAHAVQGWAST